MAIRFFMYHKMKFHYFSMCLLIFPSPSSSYLSSLLFSSLLSSYSPLPLSFLLTIFAVLDFCYLCQFLLLFYIFGHGLLVDDSATLNFFKLMFCFRYVRGERRKRESEGEEREGGEERGRKGKGRGREEIRREGCG